MCTRDSQVIYTVAPGRLDSETNIAAALYGMSQHQKRSESVSCYLKSYLIPDNAAINYIMWEVDASIHPAACHNPEHISSIMLVLSFQHTKLLHS